jgi:hypothetical protein
MKRKCILNFLGIIIVLIIASCNEGPKKKIIKNKVKQGPIFRKNEAILSPDTGVWYLEKIIEKTLYFKNNKTFRTNLYDLHYIGQLKAKHKAPFLVLSGRSCKECDENLSIFIHSPSDGAMKNEANQIRYSYPGKEFDYATNSLIFESRMFYGNCVSNKEDCIVWVQKKINNNGLFENSILTVQVNNDELKESIENVDSLNLRRFLPKCKELTGIDVTSEP